MTKLNALQGIRKVRVDEIVKNAFKKVRFVPKNRNQPSPLAVIAPQVDGRIQVSTHHVPTPHTHTLDRTRTRAQGLGASELKEAAAVAVAATATSAAAATTEEDDAVPEEDEETERAVAQQLEYERTGHQPWPERLFDAC